MLFVLDASAIIAFLRSERGADRIEEVLADPDNVCLAHSINLCEVFYDFHRAARVDRAIAVMADLTAAGV